MDFYYFKEAFLFFWLAPLQSVALLLAIRFLYYRTSRPTAYHTLKNIQETHPSADCRMLAEALLSRLNAEK